MALTALGTPPASPGESPDGDERLRAEDQVAVWPETRPALPDDEEILGRLEPGDGMLTDDTLFDVYELEGKAGDLVTMTLRSDEFDTILVVVEPGGFLLGHNDDFQPKEGSDSQLRLFLPADGRYQVWANAYQGAKGAYRLRMERSHPNETERALRLGQPAQGWLTPADETAETGSWVDEWSFVPGEEPVVVWLRSDDFDPVLVARGSDDEILAANDDLDEIGADYNARIVLAPVRPAVEGAGTAGAKAAGSALVRLRVAASGGAAAGAYRLEAWPLELPTSPRGEVRLRMFTVRGADGEGGSESTAEEIRKALDTAREVWDACGIEIVPDGPVRTVGIPGMEGVMQVTEGDWTAQERLLHALPERTGTPEGVISVFVVQATDGGEQHALAYPTTRYPSSKSGIVIGDGGIRPPESRFTLAHEIGHLLGLGHSFPHDGDPGNDTRDNLMFSPPEEPPPGPGLTPLQCLIARAAPHFVRYPSGAEPVPAPFRRHDRTLVPGGEVRGTLLPGDAVVGEGGQLLDVFYLVGKADQRVTLELTSDDFDPYLLLEGPDGQRVGEDDDGGDGQGSRLILELAAQGDYSIGVTSSIPATGGYTLRWLAP